MTWQLLNQRHTGGSLVSADMTFVSNVAIFFSLSFPVGTVWTPRATEWHTRIALTEISSIVNKVHLIAQHWGDKASNDPTNAPVLRIILRFCSDSSGLLNGNSDWRRFNVCVTRWENCWRLMGSDDPGSSKCQLFYKFYYKSNAFSDNFMTGRCKTVKEKVSLQDNPNLINCMKNCTLYNIRKWNCWHLLPFTTEF